MQDLDFHSRQAIIFEQLARQYQHLDQPLFDHFYKLLQYHKQQIWALTNNDIDPEQ
ncbi:MULTISPECIES: hypothetical protein [Pontibacillus]|uniref:Uncharacterized protein n=1 Tax=Pontibacillus chungwhensis TaxID=265426 RepID=A0ABY8UXR8_9BACI|nr:MULTISPECIES: hypothetical protein [Pontibacillus]MCD5323941.1 hypothetical protein [Pontibacillus sp. HN14]WIF97993.1 hypothetical protein QNI29_20070 [Pontibacillus chungwhensis]